MTNSQQLVDELERLGEEYATFIEGQSEAAFHFRPAPEEWTAAELTGHVAEFPVTFSTTARRIVDHPGSAVGRGLDDPGRLAAVAKLAGASPDEAARAVREGVAQAAAILRSIPPDGWQAVGQHIREGEITVRTMVERFVVGHLRIHLEQARNTVAASER